MIQNRRLLVSDLQRYHKMCTAEEWAEKVADYIDEYFSEKSIILEKTSPEKVIEVVCGHFKIDFVALARKNRERKLVHMRMICMHLLYSRTTLTYNEVGIMFNKDHTTVIHNKDRLKDLMDVYPDIRAEVEFLNSQL